VEDGTRTDDSLETEEEDELLLRAEFVDGKSSDGGAGKVESVDDDVPGEDSRQLVRAASGRVDDDGREEAERVGDAEKVRRENGQSRRRRIETRELSYKS
jgi:hypothetical protein